MPMPDMTPLSSSNVAAAGYSDEDRELTVQFTSGSTYTYSGVPRDVFDGLLAAASPGQYFQRHVKGFYNFTRGG